VIKKPRHWPSASVQWMKHDFSNNYSSFAPIFLIWRARFFGDLLKIKPKIGSFWPKSGKNRPFSAILGHFSMKIEDLKKIWGPKRRCKEDPGQNKAISARIVGHLFIFRDRLGKGGRD